MMTVEPHAELVPQTPEVFQTETRTGDTLKISGVPGKCWSIDGADQANALFEKWRELRSLGADLREQIFDAEEKLKALETHADEAIAAALLDNGKSAQVTAKDAEKERAATQAEITLLKKQLAAIPSALRSIAHQWALSACEHLLSAHHSTHANAEQVAAAVETELPALVMKWRTVSGNQSTIIRKLSSVLAECDGTARIACMRVLAGESLNAKIEREFIRSEPEIRLRAARSHVVSGGSTNYTAHF